MHLKPLRPQWVSISLTLVSVVTLMGFAVSFPQKSFAASTICSGDLAQLSGLQKIADEYAQLVHTFENMPEDSPGGTVLKEVLAKKGSEIYDLIFSGENPEETQVNIKKVILEKVKSLRMQGAGESVERDQEVINAREQEDELFQKNMVFDFKESSQTLTKYEKLELSPDGKRFVVIQNKTLSQDWIMLFSLPGGIKISEMSISTFWPVTLNFLQGGRFLSIEYWSSNSFWQLFNEAYNSLLGQQFRIERRLLLDASSGKVVKKVSQMTQHKVLPTDVDRGNLHLDISTDEKQLLVSKSGRVSLLGLPSGRKLDLKLPITERVKGVFDATSENIILMSEDFGLNPRSEKKIASWSLNKKVINWQVTTTSFHLTTDRATLITEANLGGGLYNLYDVESGKLLRTIKSSRPLFIHAAVTTSNDKYIFIPYETDGNSVGGTIYARDEVTPDINLFDVQIYTPPMTLSQTLQLAKSDAPKIRAKFLQGGASLGIITKEGRLFIWDAHSGASVKVEGVSKAIKIDAVDSDGSFFSSSWEGNLPAYMSSRPLVKINHPRSGK